MIKGFSKKLNTQTFKQGTLILLEEKILVANVDLFKILRPIHFILQTEIPQFWLT